MQDSNLKSRVFARLDHMFTDREFFMRSHGQVRFLTITAKLQKRIAAGVALVLGLWLIITLAMTVNQISVFRDQVSLAEKEAAVNSAENRIADYRESIDGVAAELKERQTVLEQMTEQFTGEELNAAEDEKLSENAQKISAAFPAAAALARLEARQIAFAHRLTRAAQKRTADAEAAIRKFGLNPDVLAKNLSGAMGGPFIPFFSSDDDNLHPTLERLNIALARMEQLESTLLTIPSAMPADISMMSSGYGYRRDPFTGRGAMHNGIDFKGPHGEPILAAARGKVTHAGWKSGYGKTVEITHGNGLMTRYAHLSRIGVRTGETVAQGNKLGAMGSTGRSTGTHLHFEVRLNGKAINPRPFLEANTDVLKVQAVARQRANASEQRSEEEGSTRG
ncbi:Murein DD-endopeptidase MepM and murein hydrolase activator NlpD, contain LysM domain [Parasphingorhabdus marina DSM 22363]|uniref:Murein DD-endopeptidase MepM and murein hydrolase activator NlpD, contain LysM domain n=1 Tax=Parasphingorhabdus marina DSM 22363 TaxID=1123272 RepID=A0A1N6CNJ1_9SPHN|nr:M23 family metallopeptidase [Parasphingorhabdus marina]SIN59934.1 Murein DD-endopeptidase MepM and murein hydrolase activator NlpD, contain LysM domain [Parasphingorhabdus marina DSM 22363]